MKKLKLWWIAWRNQRCNIPCLGPHCGKPAISCCYFYFGLWKLYLCETHAWIGGAPK